MTQLIALTRRTALFIGGDTGPMHLAAALGVPVVGIFGPTDPARNGPFGTRNIVLRSGSSTTSYRHVADADEGLLEISCRASCRRRAAAAGGAPWLAGLRSRAGSGCRWALSSPYSISGWPSLLVQSILIGAALVIPGLVIRALASGQLQKNEQLATAGLYAYTRNPLYLGSLIFAVGFALASRSWWIVGGIVVLFFAIYLPVIRGEEVFLRQRFPQFEDYARQVPRLVPAADRIQQGRRSVQLGLYWKHREYNAALGAAAMLAALVAKMLIWP